MSNGLFLTFFFATLLLTGPALAANKSTAISSYIKGEVLEEGAAAARSPADSVGTALGLVDLRSRIAADLQAGWREFVPQLREAVGGEDSIAAVREIEPRFRALEARHQLYLSRLDRTEALASGVGSRYAERVQAQRAAYLERVGPVFGHLDDFYRIQGLPPVEVNDLDPTGWFERASRWVRSRFSLWVASYRAGGLIEDVVKRARPHLRASTLPYRERSAPLRAPAFPTPILPAYESEDIDPLVADRSPSPTAPFTDPLRLLAESLDYDAIAIFNYVRNEIRPAWYAGAMKGAEGTLASGAGNDVDQASLLVALMRIASLPARFVHGVVEIPLETLRESFATSIDEEALRALRVSGIAHEPIIRGGRVAAVLMERTWVTVKLPYSNYRGTLVDASGSIWLPLDPAFKPLESAPFVPVLAELSLDAAARVTMYLTADRAETLLDELRVEAQTHLDQNGSTFEYDEVVADSAIVQGETGYLPTTLPYRVEQVSFEGAALEAALVQSAQFVIYEAEDVGSAIVLSEEVPLPDLHDRRVTLSYVPATPDDHEVVRRFGGLLNTPAFLIQIRPQLKVGGQVVATGTSMMAMGVVHRLDVKLSSPALEESVTKTLLSGSYHAMALTHSDAVLTLDIEDDPSDTEGPAARILSQIALRYQKAWTSAEQELAGLSGVTVLRPLPSLVFASNAVDIDFLLDQPQQIIWEGVELDVGLRLVEGISRAPGSYALSGFFRLSALEGSILEHRRFEEDFDVSAISADRAVALANEAAIEVVRLDQANLATEIVRLAHPDDVKTILEDWVGQGLTVRTPISEITDADWTGFAWIVQDEQSGAAGYFISGDIGGGATTANAWANTAIQNALSSPYSEEGNEDSLAGATVLLIPGSDGQEGVVGTSVANPFSVLVLDVDGRPVVGATVKFAVAAGAGNFTVIGGLSEFETTTGANGIATSETFFLGTDVDLNPVFLGTDAGPQKALETLVDVTVPRFDPDTKELGDIKPSQPFAVFGLPGSVATLRPVSYFASVSLEFGHGLEVKAVDQYENEIAHQDVTVSYLGPATIPGQAQFVNGFVMRPGSPNQLSSATSPTGVTIGAFFSLWTGNAFSTSYDFQLSAAGVSEDISLTMSGTSTAIKVFRPASTDQATKVTQVYPGQLRFTVRKLIPIDENNNALGRWLDPVELSNVQITAQGAGASIETTSPFQLKGMDFQIKVGPTVGVYTATATGDLRFEDEVNPTSGFNFGNVSGNVYALNPAITTFSPETVVLNDADRNDENFVVQYNLNQPAGYASRVVQIFVRNGQTSHLFAPGTTLQGVGEARFARGEAFPVNGSYTVEVISNLGQLSEARSAPIAFPLDRDVIAFVQKRVRATEEVDLLNQRSCATPARLTFQLKEAATVEVSATHSGSGSDPGVVLVSQVFAAGVRHVVPLDQSGFEEGAYDFLLTATSTVRAKTETQTGTIEIEVERRLVPPVGHARYNEVDLFDGSLSFSRSDLSLGGRGPEMAFSRTYTSSNDHSGFLGIGWSHNLESRLRISTCATVAVRGIRFFDQAGEFSPEEGRNGTLRRVGNDFDLYTPDGTRYHYRQFGFDTPSTRTLEFIEDTNGNLTKFGYSPQSGRAPELTLVEDDAGRKIELEYGWIGADRRIRKVNGLDSHRIRFDYDQAGRLREAHESRGGLTRVERYDYVVDGPDYILDPVACPAEVMDCPSAIPPRHVGVAEFNLRGSLLSTTDAEGATTQYTYQAQPFFGGQDLNGGVVSTQFVTRIDHPESGPTLITYGDRSVRTGTLETRVMDPRSFETVHTLNQYGSPVEIARPLATRSMVWSANKIRITQRIDENNFVQTLDYDDNGNIIFEQVEASVPLLRTFEPLADETIKNRVSIETDRNGLDTRRFYDARGNLLRVEYPDGGVEENVFASNGDRIRTLDPNGNVTQFSYDPFGHLELVTDALGHVSRDRWDERGRRLESTDPRGNTTRYRYDDFDRLVEKIDPGEISRFYEYDENDRKITEIDEEGRTTRWEYDAEGRVTRTLNAALSEQLKTYDTAGNLLTETDWNGNLTSHEYDANGRRTRSIEPEGRIVELEYDAFGNLILERRQLGRETIFRYDDRHRRVEIEDAQQGISQTEYDDEGNVTARIDAENRRTEFEYDERNRLRFTRQPGGRVTERQYDFSGNLVAVIDARGNTTRTEYDSLNRPIVVIDAIGNRTLFEYDEVGNLTREIDSRGNATLYVFDALNREISRLDSENNLYEKEYDRIGNLTLERWPNGNVFERDYDVLNRVSEFRDVMGVLSQTGYDANGNLTIETDSRGIVSSFEYDELNRRTRSVFSEGREILAEYDVLGNRTRETDANLNVRRFEYDTLDRLFREYDPLDRFVEHAYDAVGNRTSTLDRRNLTTLSRYDDLDQVVEVEDALNQIRTIAYDLVGNVATTTDQRGNSTVTEYDANNRVVGIVRSGLRILSREYDEISNVLFETDANGNLVGFEYDKLSRVTSENRPLASIQRISYDAIGNRVSERDPEGRYVHRSFDVRRRKISESINATSPSNGTETTLFEYDESGNQTRMTRPESNAWGFEYDDADRLVLVRDPDLEETTYGYDENGNRTSQTDALLRTTLLRYDEFDRVREREEPGLALTVLSYNENGNLSREIKANGIVIDFVYDSLDRETLRSFSLPAVPTGDDPATLAFTYDATDNTTQIVESYHAASRPDRTTTFGYDVFDRKVTTTDAFGETIGYAYDPNGNRTQLTDPDGLVTTNAFDALNRLISVANASGVTTYDYDRSGRISSIVYPNGTRSNRFYDAAGRIDLIENLQASVVVSSFDYTADLNGNLIQEIETNGGGPETTTYSYDNLDRLTTVVYPTGMAGPGSTVTYAYDAVYNRTTEQEVEAATGTTTKDRGYAYDNRNRLTTLTDLLDSNQTATYTHDANGNQTSKTVGAVTTQFNRDARDHLRSVTQGGSSLGEFLYDYRGLRVEKLGERGIERTTYDEASPLIQSDGTGTTIAKYEYGGQRLLSLDHRDDGLSFYLFDALGSVVNLTSQSGTVDTRYFYDAYGGVKATIGASWNRFGFSGHERDNETGLIYMKNRFYDPDTGRFLGEDSAPGDAGKPPSLHRYLYVFGNPTTFVDPDGRIPFLSNLVDSLRSGAASIDAALAAGDVEQRSALGSLQGLANSTTAGVFGLLKVGLLAAAETLNTVDFSVDATIAVSANAAQAYGLDAVAPGLLSSEVVRSSQHRLDANVESASSLAAKTRDLYDSGELADAGFAAYNAAALGIGETLQAAFIEGDLQATGTVIGAAGAIIAGPAGARATTALRSAAATKKAAGLAGQGQRLARNAGDAAKELRRLELSRKTGRPRDLNQGINERGLAEAARIDRGIPKPPDIARDIVFDAKAGRFLNTVTGRFVSRAKATRGGAFTFRGDSRAPSQIFNEGFSARGSSTDLFAHALDNTRPPSAFVSTSRSSSIAADFGDNVFVVRPRGGVDVNRTLGSTSPFPDELEVAVPFRIAPSDVRGVTIPGQGVSILNPRFRP